MFSILYNYYVYYLFQLYPSDPSSTYSPIRNVWYSRLGYTCVLIMYLQHTLHHVIHIDMIISTKHSHPLIDNTYIYNIFITHA